jgi:cytochrome d ubiquinol oxidase subunit II
MTLFDMPPGDWLPVVFLALLGVSALVYVVLDGFDLGVGLLSVLVGEDDRTLMISSIGPFWDANETWLVLAVGLLLVAFPTAHGIVLGALYLPTTLMLVGLTLRGVAFEFRAKGPDGQRRLWDIAFFAGSLIATVSQGYMLGYYVIGLTTGIYSTLFATLVAVCLTAAYGLVGACWLIAKTSGALQMQSIVWSRYLLVGTVAGMFAISVATPLASERIFNAWFSLPNFFLLAPIPLVSIGLVVALYVVLRHTPLHQARWHWVPFSLTTVLFILAFAGLAYSFFPYIVPDQLTIWDAAAASESLLIILVGTLITLPMIAGYSVFAYRVFRGKATELTY